MKDIIPLSPSERALIYGLFRGPYQNYSVQDLLDCPPIVLVGVSPNLMDSFDAISAKSLRALGGHPVFVKTLSSGLLDFGERPAELKLHIEKIVGSLNAEAIAGYGPFNIARRLLISE